MEIRNLVAVEYFLDKWIPKILIIRRDVDNKKKIEEINNFLPYIYCNEEDLDLIKNEFGKDIAGISRTDKKYIIDKNKKLIKITLKNPLSVYKIKERFKCCEADILFCNKFIIDKVDKLESPNKYRFNYLDIETTSEKGFPDYLNPIENIISMVSYDSYLNKYFLWIWHDKYKEEKLEVIGEFESVIEIRRFNKEEDMLNNFLDFMILTKPDFIASWHVSFDITYLIARLELLKLDYNKLSPLYDTQYKNSFYKGLVEWKVGPGVYGKRFGTSEKQKHVEIKGLYYFDLLTAYKNIIAQELPSFKLDDIAQKELGMNKTRTHFNIGETWKKDPEFIEKYNYMDVLILKKLDEKMKILERYNTIKDKSFLYNINDVFSSGRVLDNFILKRNKDTLIFPSKNFEEDRDTRIAGGFVRTPIPEVYSNVAVFDFSGFYPNLMKTFNLSGEKLINEDILVFDTEIEETTDVKQILPEKMFYYNEEKKEILYEIRTNKFSADLTYKLDNLGVMPQSVEELMNLRNSYKREMKNFKYGSVDYNQLFNSQFSMKFLINASYGVSAYPGFRLFKLHNANAITAFARMLSKWVEFKLKEHCYITKSGDTDSLFVQLHTEKLEDNLKENEHIEEIIKEAINEFVRKYLPEEFAKNHTLKMDCEKIYSKLLLLDVKKRYIGLLKYYDGEEVNDKLHYMGIDSKKSNNTLISKEAALELAIAILKKQDVKLVMDKYYKQVKTSEDFDLFKLSSKLEKPQAAYGSKTPAVKASLWSNTNLKTQFRAGSKFYILYVKNIPDVNEIAFDDIEQLKNLKVEINREKYIKDLYNKFNNLIRGIPRYNEINEMMYNRYLNNNKSLNDFF